MNDSATAARTRRAQGGTLLWRAAAVGCAVYYVLVFTLGRWQTYNRYILWLGGLVMGILAAMAYVQRPVKVPPAVWFFVLFVLWALIGLRMALDLTAYLYALKLIAVHCCLFALVALTCRATGGVKWLYAGFCIVGVLNTIMAQGGLGIDVASVVDAQVGVRTASVGDVTSNANALAWLNCIGILGGLGVLGDTRSSLLRGACLAAIGIQGLGLLLAASRGALISTLEALVLYPFLCYWSLVRRKVWVALLACVMIAVVVLGVSIALENTYVGTRFRRPMQSDREEPRSWLIKEGFKVFLAQPITGVGLHQTTAYTGIRLFTHCEYTELLATTGIVGFAFFYGIYIVSFRQLHQHAWRVPDAAGRFRANFSRLLIVVIVLSGFYNISYFFFGLVCVLGTFAGIAGWAQDQAHMRREMYRGRQRLGLRLREHVPYRPKAEGVPRFL